MMATAALCLDLDDTLWPVGPAIIGAEAAAVEFLARYYPHVAAQNTIADMRAWRLRVAIEHPARGHDLTWLRQEALRQQAVAAGCGPAEAERMAAATFEVFFAARHAVEPYAEVAEALERLAAAFPLYALSTGNAELERTPLGGYFRAAFSARGLGVAKPDRAAFLAVVKAAGIAPQAMLHVGDDPQADVHGAQQAGLRTAWIHRGQQHWPEALPRADHEFADLGGLADYLLGPV